MKRVRPGHPLITAGVVLSMITVLGTPARAAEPSAPVLRLVTSASSVTVDRWPGDPGVLLDLGAHVSVSGTPLELRVARASYRHQLAATQVIREGGETRTRTLPAGTVKDFSGLPGFLSVSVTNAAGKKVLTQNQTFCPNGMGGRTSPEAPATSHYPEYCPGNPFTLGSVWGIEPGWAVAVTGTPVKLADGKYTATLSVTKSYRDLFGMPAEQKTVKFTVRTRKDGGGPPSALSSSAGTTPRPNAARPTGRASVPEGPKPDLRALPAWDIAVSRDQPSAAAPRKDYLQFSANVWNAGPSPLVVDGFRRTGKDVMDAYQYFYDGSGKQVGYSPAGTMEWDARDGHDHWHFTDFAGYYLLDSKQKKIVRSQKEAFCLANTDAIDYTVENANWKPYNTDLHTACGQQTALSVREVLDVGSGDTYVQDLPGQSFDISRLPNGTYFIKVVANPAHRLYETSLKNNVSLRKVILTGKPGARKVRVPAYQLVNAR
jgi:hypothetical protein